MASRTEALVRNFLKTDGDVLYLVPGEKISLLKGTTKMVVGRENLGEESFRAVAAELVPGAPVESLAAMKHRTPFRIDDATEPVEIQFGRSGTSVAIMICRVRAEEPAPSPEPAPVPVRPVEPPPRPAHPTTAVRSLGTTGAFSMTGAIAVPRPAPEVVPLEVPDSLSAASQDMDGSLARLSSGRRRSERPLDEALRRLAEQGGADLHAVPGAPAGFRVAGELALADDLTPFVPDELEKAIQGLLPDRARREVESRGSAVFSFVHPEAGRLRVRAARVQGGLAAEFRRIAAAPPDPEKIGVPPMALRLASSRSGLLVVAGPPGSGKTTVRAALLAFALAERPRVAVLVEDPAEVAVPRGLGVVSAREVGLHAPSAADALRGAAGTDADLLAAPEPRDAETLGLVLDAAARRLVVLELTAPTVHDAVDQLLDLVPESRLPRTRDLLAGLLRGVLVTRLVPLEAGGRMPVFDLLVVTGAAASLMREGKSFQLSSLLVAGRAQGMASANDVLADLVKRRAVSTPAALAASPDPAALRTILGAAPPG